jgi:hypothetical protein
MTLPSFTVDASLYPMSERYRLVTCVTDSLGVVFVPGHQVLAVLRPVNWRNDRR